MKSPLILLFPLIVLLTGTMACNMENNPATDGFGAENSNEETITATTGNRLRIRIGSRTFSATLLDNLTVTAFKARLPMTVTMSELNGNEKYYNFPKDLPTNASNHGTIQTGDLMLYGSNTLVLFYQSFPTPYSYTKLGRIDNPAELAATVGAGRITATFDLD